MYHGGLTKRSIFCGKSIVLSPNIVLKIIKYFIFLVGYLGQTPIAIAYVIALFTMQDLTPMPSHHRVLLLSQRSQPGNPLGK
jgi:hypothetical protein